MFYSYIYGLFLHGNIQTYGMNIRIQPTLSMSMQSNSVKGHVKEQLVDVQTELFCGQEGQGGG